MTTSKLFMKIAYVETFYEDFLEITSFPCQIGRDPGNQIALMGHEISRKHAEIFERDGKLFIKDLESRSGIWHEGKSIKEIEIVEGLQIRMGQAVLFFSKEHFPLEQTISYGHIEERIHHEPFMKRIEAMLEGKSAFILFFILLGFAYFTAPDFYRKSDSVKNLISSLINTSFVAPFILTIGIVIFRKVNRGEYSWNRSLWMAYLLCIGGQLVNILERSLCWFIAFDFIWNSVVFNILIMAVFFFWWFLAVGKNTSFHTRAVRALVLASVVYALVAGVQFLTTGYKSNYELESCDSLTGWHWGNGEELSSLEDFLSKSAKSF